MGRNSWDKGIRNHFFMIIEDMMDDNRDEIYKAYYAIVSRLFHFSAMNGDERNSERRYLILNSIETEFYEE